MQRPVAQGDFYYPVRPREFRTAHDLMREVRYQRQISPIPEWPAYQDCALPQNLEARLTACDVFDAWNNMLVP
jgi:hypothetical protein